MELTKEQIETIENRLQQNGLSYWDIRIEILDHIVSEIENKLSKGEPYDSAIENSFYKLNLNGNLESLNKSRLLAVNKIVKIQYFNKVKSFFKSIKNLILITTFLIAYSLVFVLLNKTIFLYVSAFLLFAPVITGAFLYFKEYAKKKKSCYLIYSSFYIFFSFLMLNIFIQFFQSEGIFPVSKDTQKTIWFLVTIVNTLFSVGGLSIYFETRKKILGIEKKIKLQ